MDRWLRCYGKGCGGWPAVFRWKAIISPGRLLPGAIPPPEGPLPAYLRPDYYEAIRACAPRVEVRHESVTELLARRPEASVDRFCLLDAQDWMTPRQLNALWREISRTAAPGARVIFRTAGEESILPARLDPGLMSRWAYREAESVECTRRDRSAIYGGFHLYEKNEA